MKRALLPLALGLLLLAPSARAEEQATGKDPEAGVHLGATAGIRVPDGARGDVLLRIGKVLSLGAGAGFLPELTVPGAGVRVARVAGEGWLRVHPGSGAFYLGVAGGVSSIEGSATDREVAGVLETKATIRQAYVTPHLGAMWRLPLGMTLGTGIGVLVPVASSDPRITTTLDGRSVGVTPGTVTDAARLVARTPLPVVHLLDFGVVL